MIGDTPQEQAFHAVKALTRGDTVEINGNEHTVDERPWTEHFGLGTTKARVALADGTTLKAKRNVPRDINAAADVTITHVKDTHATAFGVHDDAHGIDTLTVDGETYTIDTDDNRDHVFPTA